MARGSCSLGDYQTVPPSILGLLPVHGHTAKSTGLDCLPKRHLATSAPRDGQGSLQLHPLALAVFGWLLEVVWWLCCVKGQMGTLTYPPAEAGKISMAP